MKTTDPIAKGLQMKALLVTAIFGFCAYMSWNTIQALATGGPEPLREGAYVVVYGRGRPCRR